MKNIHFPSGEQMCRSHHCVTDSERCLFVVVCFCFSSIVRGRRVSVLKFNSVVCALRALQRRGSIMSALMLAWAPICGSDREGQIMVRHRKTDSPLRKYGCRTKNLIYFHVLYRVLAFNCKLCKQKLHQTPFVGCMFTAHASHRSDSEVVLLPIVHTDSRGTIMQKYGKCGA